MTSGGGILGTSQSLAGIFINQTQKCNFLFFRMILVRFLLFRQHILNDVNIKTCSLQGQSFNANQPMTVMFRVKSPKVLKYCSIFEILF